jgi:hypothetical protein
MSSAAPAYHSFCYAGAELVITYVLLCWWHQSEVFAEATSCVVAANFVGRVCDIS